MGHVYDYTDKIGERAIRNEQIARFRNKKKLKKYYRSEEYKEYNKRFIQLAYIVLILIILLILKLLLHL